MISEESKGGIKYEVTIGEPKVVTPPRVASPVMSNNKTPISAEVIQQKLEAAAERRQVSAEFTKDKCGGHHYSGIT